MRTANAKNWSDDEKRLLSEMVRQNIAVKKIEVIFDQRKPSAIRSMINNLKHQGLVPIEKTIPLELGTEDVVSVLSRIEKILKEKLR